MTDPIRIFVGCAPNHDDAESQAVLEYTLRKHASRPVNIVWMKLSRDPASPFFGWRTDQWATPFSGFRWAVPWLADFTGRAIYMDSDMICRADIAELFDMPLRPSTVVAARSAGRLCVSLWNCEKAAEVMPEIDFIRGRSDAHSFMASYMVSHGVQEFPPDQNWNCLDGEQYSTLEHSHIRMIHYTSMPHQPHITKARERLAAVGRTHWFDGKVTPHWRSDLVQLFDKLLAEAEQAGYSVSGYCNDSVYGDFPKAGLGALRGEIPSWGR